METEVRGRINWTPTEVEQVARRYLELKAANPRLGEGAGLNEAQKILPENRQRGNLCGLSQVPRVAKYIASLHGVNLMNPEANGQAAPVTTVDPQKTLADTPVEKLIEAIRTRQPELLKPPPPPSVEDFADDDLIAALVARRPDLFLAAAPTSTLLEMVLGRFFHILTTERQRIEQAVTVAVVEKLGERVLTQLNADRAKFEQRLYDIQSQIRGLANGGIKNQVSAPAAPAPEDKNAYMPLFLLAGGDRQDFQRLQSQMMNASIRLQKIDVSKPQHISIPTHDRTVLWTAKLPTDLQSNIRGKVNPNKLVVHAGTFDELGPVIVREAQRVREAK